MSALTLRFAGALLCVSCSLAYGASTPVALGEWDVDNGGSIAVDDSGFVYVASRVIPNQVHTIDDLHLPPIVKELTDLPRGLVLVTGHTGSGKSTSLAAMIGLINSRYSKRIITLEDPVEYHLENERCMIEQREIGSDCPNFASGLRHALRQDVGTRAEQDLIHGIDNFHLQVLRMHRKQMLTRGRISYVEAFTHQIGRVDLALAISHAGKRAQDMSRLREDEETHLSH